MLEYNNTTITKMTTSSKSPKRSRGENGVTEKVARAKSVVRLSDQKYEVVCNKVKNILLGVNALLPRNKWQSYQTSDYDNRPPNNIFAQFPVHEEEEIRDLDGPPSLEKIPLLAEKLQSPEWGYEHYHITSDALQQSIVFPLGCYHGYSFRLILNEGYAPNEPGGCTVLHHDCHIILEMALSPASKVRFCIQMEEDECPDRFILSIHFDFEQKMDYMDRLRTEEAMWKNRYGTSIQEVLLSLLRQQNKGHDDDGPFLQLFYDPNNRVKPDLLDQFAEVGLQM